MLKKMASLDRKAREIQKQNGGKMASARKMAKKELGL
jgi:hypothetical protein